MDTVDKEAILGEGYGMGMCVKVRGLGAFGGPAVSSGLMEHVAHNGEWQEKRSGQGVELRIWKFSAARLRRWSSSVGHGMPLVVLVPRSIMIEKINP